MSCPSFSALWCAGAHRPYTLVNTRTECIYIVAPLFIIDTDAPGVTTSHELEMKCRTNRRFPTGETAWVGDDGSRRRTDANTAAMSDENLESVSLQICPGIDNVPSLCALTESVEWVPC